MQDLQPLDNSRESFIDEQIKLGASEKEALESWYDYQENEEAKILRRTLTLEDYRRIRADPPITEEEFKYISKNYGNITIDKIIRMAHSYKTAVEAAQKSSEKQPAQKQVHQPARPSAHVSTPSTSRQVHVAQTHQQPSEQTPAALQESVARRVAAIARHVNPTVAPFLERLETAIKTLIAENPTVTYQLLNHVFSEVTNENSDEWATQFLSDTNTTTLSKLVNEYTSNQQVESWASDFSAQTSARTSKTKELHSTIAAFKHDIISLLPTSRQALSMLLSTAISSAARAQTQTVARLQRSHSILPPMDRANINVQNLQQLHPQRQQRFMPVGPGMVPGMVRGMGGGKVLNPASGRYVNVDGKIGKELLAARHH